MMKMMAKITIVQLRFSHLRAMVLSRTWEMIPSEMELVMTMAKRVMKQGSPSSYELKSM